MRRGDAEEDGAEEGTVMEVVSAGLRAPRAARKRWRSTVPKGEVVGQ